MHKNYMMIVNVPVPCASVQGVSAGPIGWSPRSMCLPERNATKHRLPFGGKLADRTNKNPPNQTFLLFPPSGMGPAESMLLPKILIMRCKH